METKEENTVHNNWSLPGEPISEKDLKENIKSVEKGTFFSVEESKKILSEWRKQRNQRK